MYNVLIIGSGCAGLTAAIYAGRANLKPLVLDGHEPGGQLSLTTHVENYPGFPDGIMGPELIENMRKQAQRFGAEFKAGAVTEVDVSKRPFKIIAGKDVYETRALIVAAGASARPAGAEGRKRIDRAWRFNLCDLRRLFFPRQTHRRGWRGRFGHGRGQLSVALRQQGPLIHRRMISAPPRS